MKEIFSYDARLAAFKELIKKIEYLKYTLNSLVYWDKITYMPPKGIEYRTSVMSFLADEQYKLIFGKEFAENVRYFRDNKKKRQSYRRHGQKNMPEFEVYKQGSRGRIPQIC